MKKETRHLSEKQALLLALKELSGKEGKAADAHIKQCDSCKQLTGEYRTFAERLHHASRLEPTEALLIRSRRLLELSLARKTAGRVKDPVWDRIAGFLFPGPAVRQLASCAAVFATGILIGTMVMQKEPADRSTFEMRDIFQSTVPLSDFRIIPSAEDPDRLEIAFLASREVRLSGTLSDPTIQYALAYALVNDPRDNVRLKSVDLLGEYTQKEFIQKALVRALEKDENPGVRIKAIGLLKSLPLNQSIKEVFIQTLFRDSNQGVRIEAANSLARSDEPDVLALLEEQAEKDEYMHSILYRKEELSEKKMENICL